ncbi:MAG: 16S rRNA (guanine(527)-N(7))-methyltransferase RsmG [candidate division SR1 bacterium]|nr:MAG: 16S rRNA (guanine(527)-N(7))-methyltransferase RsmG [candidate division SR1 bacterium]
MQNINQKKLEQLAQIFQEKNQQINLSAIRDLEGIKIKHIQDSLELNKILKLPAGKKFCDIGTGGGFPLLPLAITNPEVTFHGIDARRKKVDTVNGFIDALNLSNAKVLRGRIENFASKKAYQASFDYISARAVGYVDKLFAWATPLLKTGGCFILYKQANPEEYDAMMKLLKKYHLTLEKKHTYQLFEGDIQRVIYVIKKT